MHLKQAGSATFALSWTAVSDSTSISDGFIADSQERERDFNFVKEYPRKHLMRIDYLEVALH
ncbi:hypothetical protein [Vreelandella sp. EE27]